MSREDRVMSHLKNSIGTVRNLVLLGQSSECRI